MGRSGERKRAAWSPRHTSVGWAGLGWGVVLEGRPSPPPWSSAEDLCALWYLKGQAWEAEPDGAC